MERKVMLTVCNKGTKGGGKRKTKRQAVLEKRGKTVKDRREIEKPTLEDEKLLNAEESSSDTLHATCLVVVLLHRGAGDIPAEKHSGMHKTHSQGTITLHP
jgi:hypothetical protein